MHLFKDELGKTFNECLTDCRIQVAKDLLRDPKYKVYEVSEIVGYGDVKYFSQVFRKNTGMSPSEYIKNKT
jgi:two-component system response regulator YesN